ncbi:uncharacterized protein LOC141936816 [Strix uralensis]|uniref:uncharacterized protein LOC141936816 n=1 Tax=Strix uralensis TaxID=36305 RepID=UPI003DA770FC
MANGLSGGSVSVTLSLTHRQLDPTQQNGICNSYDSVIFVRIFARRITGKKKTCCSRQGSSQKKLSSLLVFIRASWDTLRACAEFLGWRRLSFLAETGQTPLIGEYLIMHKRNSPDEYLLQSLLYVENPQASVREAAVRFIGLAARRWRILRLEKLWEICQSALQSLENDAEHSIRCLAAQTVLILTALKQKPRSGWSLRSLWCCA